MLAETRVTPPLSGLLMALNTALYGFTMALLFFSPVARYFDREPTV